MYTFEALLLLLLQEQELKLQHKTSWCSVLLGLFNCMSCFLYTESCTKLKFLVCAHILDPDGCVYSELYLVNYVQVVSVSRIKWVSLTKRLAHIVPEKPQCSNGLCSRGVPCRGSINPSSHSVWQSASAWHEDGGEVGMRLLQPQHNSHEPISYQCFHTEHGLCVPPYI